MATQIDPPSMTVFQLAMNDGQVPEQTHTPELSMHEARTAALVVQLRIVTRAKRLNIIVVVVLLFCFLDR